MARLVTTGDGIGRLEDERVVLLDSPHADLGAALAAGLDVAAIAALPARAELALEDVTLLAPVPRPSKIWAAGWSYREHADESGREVDAGDPFFFLKAPSSITGPGTPIRLPAGAPDRVDYEGEIAIVIGTRATAVDEAGALAHIAGLTAANDVSARDVQKGEGEGRQPNVSLGKSFDSFTPLGPCLVGLDAFPDVADIGLRTTVDGEQRQEARTSQLVYGLARQVAFLSAHTTLEPGDVILTGTPAGVGFHRGSFLRDGAVVRVTVEQVGTLENRVVGP